ncbi:aspartate/glutamate racemase family protein [Celeribacter indicus]|nr:aspartate/glutamate racemase family protein [Celeribacter indicus]SDW10021.1 maleate isomerase/arylmalonate decarboxylase [Celeribacter indicus]
MTRPASSYSMRARIGLIVPPTNTVNEAEWSRLLPEGATAHSHRMALHTDTQSTEGIAALKTDLEAAVAMLAPMRPDVVAYACTAGSLVTPSDALGAEISARSGVSVITTADSLVQALRHLGAGRIGLATPYSEAMNAHEVAFLAAHGIETLAVAGLGLGARGAWEYPKIAQTPLATVERLARQVGAADVAALVISCTDFPTLPLIAPLERELGIPVLTSNTATLWRCLGHVPDPEETRRDPRLRAAGRLFGA